MSGTPLPADTSGEFVPVAKSRVRALILGWLRRDWPYFLMLAAAFAGIAYSATGGPLITGFGPRLIYIWMVLVPLFGVICIIEGWNRVAGSIGAGRMLISQVLHWLAVYGAMYITLQPDVRGIVNANATGLLLLTLLALGTFLAGLHSWSLGVCVVGLFLTAAIPAIAWVQKTELLLLVTGIGVFLLVLVSWMSWRWKARRTRA